MNGSRRQQPPPSRSSLHIVLIVAGMILAGGIGWMASSYFGQGSEERRAAKKQVASNSAASNLSDLSEDEDLASSKSAGASSELNGSESDERNPKSALVKRKSFDRDKERAESKKELKGDWRKDESKSRSKRVTPKLSDLTTYKKNPNRDPIKLPKTSRNKTTRAKIENEGTQPLAKEDQAEKNQAKSPKSSDVESSKGTSTSEINQYAFPQQSTPITFFQELIVDRNPVFGIEGIRSMEQKFKYRAISKLSVGPADSRGFRKVIQEVVAASLISSDALSRKSLTESVKKLVGKKFQFTFDKRQKLVDFKGEKDKPKSLDLKDLGGLKGLLGDGKIGEGFMVSSVMDLDGWKEMAQLTFLLPDGNKKKWSGQMEHDWGEIGRWVGETRFEKKGKTNGRLRIDYAHWMRYEPPKDGAKSSLPFALGEVAFKSDEAGGRLQFNTEKNRIDSLVERFKVEGQVTASLLGGSTKLNIKEVQTFELYLHDQRPQ